MFTNKLLTFLIFFTFVILNGYTKQFNNINFFLEDTSQFKNILKKIKNLNLLNKTYNKIYRIDVVYGNDIVITVKGFIKLNNLIYEELNRYIKLLKIKKDVILDSKNNQINIKNNLKKNETLLNNYIKIILKTKNKLNDRANYLMFLESLKDVALIEIETAIILKQSNPILKRFLNTKLKLLLKNQISQLKNYTNFELIKIYFNKIYYLLEEEEIRVIKDKINGLNSFTKKSMKDKYIFEKISKYNINNIFDDLLELVKKYSILSINYNENKLEKIILNSMKKIEHKRKFCYEISPGIKICKNN